MKRLAVDAVNLLRQNARSVVRELGLLNDAFFEIDVTLAERHLLIELNTLLSPTIGDIAERLLLDKSTVSRLIAKAVKKGYVVYVADTKDKRKRCLQLTEKGRKVLNEFERIAFKQSNDALHTLTQEEIEIVYRGIELYSQALKNARIRNRETTNIITPKNRLITEIYRELQNAGFTLDLFVNDDEKQLYDIFRQVVDTGDFFPYKSSSVEEFKRHFFGPHSHVYVCHSETEVAGGFYIKQNYSGRSSHIANAAYMLKDSYRGQGLGTLLVKASLQIAKVLGFEAMQFNMVLQQNSSAIKLYQKLGFEIVGTIPEAIRNDDGSAQDGYVMFRKL